MKFGKPLGHQVPVTIVRTETRIVPEPAVEVEIYGLDASEMDIGSR